MNVPGKHKFFQIDQNSSNFSVKNSKHLVSPFEMLSIYPDNNEIDTSFETVTSGK